MCKTVNLNRGGLLALFAVMVAAVCALALVPKPVAAEQTGKLTITNRVEPEEDTTEFEFTVRVGADGTQIKYQIDGGEQKDGTSPLTVSLKGGQTLKITEIPLNINAGATYSVVEKEYSGWTYAVEGMVNGRLTQDSDYANTVTFKNTKASDPIALKVASTKVSPATCAPTKSDETATITDTVSIEGATEAVEYTVAGKLVLQDDTSTAVGNASTTVTATSDKPEATLEYKDVPVGLHAGKKLVSFVTIKDNNGTTATHEDANDPAQTVTINPLPELGTLAISKEIDTPRANAAISAGEDVSKWEARKRAMSKKLANETTRPSFEFTVKLVNDAGVELEGEYQYSGASQGTIKSGGTIVLAPEALNEVKTITIEGLPAGTKYTVTEKDAKSFTTAHKEQTGTIAHNQTAKAAFTNTPLGTLKIVKKIDTSAYDKLIQSTDDALSEYTNLQSSAADAAIRQRYQALIDAANEHKAELEDKKTQAVATEFTFTVTLSDAEGKALTGNKTYPTVNPDGTSGTIEFENGVATTKLKGGEELYINSLDLDYNVTIAEAPTSGWVANHAKLGGTFEEGVTLTATFTNTSTGLDESNDNSKKSNSSGKTGAAAAPLTRNNNGTLARTADPSSMAAVVMAVAGAGLAVAGGIRRRA